MFRMIRNWYWSLQYRFLLCFSYVQALEERYDMQGIALEDMITEYDALSTYMGEQGIKYAKVLSQLADDLHEQRVEYCEEMCASYETR